MICKHEMTLELMGAPRPARITYTPDPSDGYPRIEAVEIERAVHTAGYYTVDLLPILDEADLLRLEQAVCEARLLWRESA